MTDQYIRDLLRVSVSQICQTIGYNSIQMTPLELLTDNLHKFLQEFSKDLHRHVELFNRTEANCDDATLTLANLNIGLNDINEYVCHVQAVPCAIDIPKFPARKESYLNFLKPGSKEVLTRPVHIYEYLPPILNEENDDIKCIITTTTSTTTNTTTTTTTSLTTPYNVQYSMPGSPLQAIEAKKDDNIVDCTDIGAAATGTVVINASITSATTPKNEYTTFADENTIENSSSSTNNGYKLLANGISLNSDSKPALLPTLSSSSSSEQQIPQKIRSVLAGRISTTDSTEGRPTREISSVMMTTGGFISPAMEGKLPDTKIPEIIEEIEISTNSLPALPVQPPPPPAQQQQQQQQQQQPTQQTPSLMPLSSSSLSTTSPIPSSSSSSTIRTSNIPNLSMISSQSQHMLPNNNKNTAGRETVDTNNPSIKNSSALRMPKKKNQNHPAMQMIFNNYDRQMMKKVSKRKGGTPSSSTKINMSSNISSSNFVNGLSLPQLSNANLFSSATTQITTPTAPGTGTNEKTKRKRLKLIQKSTTKSSSNNNNVCGNGSNINFDRNIGVGGCNIGYHSKMKNCYNLSKLDRTTEMNDKLMRKQHKLKQKRLRHQMQKRQTNEKLLGNINPMSRTTTHDDILAKKNIAVTANESPEKFKNIRKDTFNSTILQLSQSNNDSINNDTLTAVGGIGIGGVAGGGATSTTATLFQEQSSIASVNDNFTDSIFSMNKNKLATTADEIKLSTEPDRTKLNIFKKISSSSRERRDQKSITGSSSSPFLLPSDGSTGAAATSSNALFLNENHQHQKIGGLSCLPNLPSGTTITPTPPSGRHVYAPPPSSSSIPTPPSITGTTATTPIVATTTTLPTSSAGAAAGDSCHISDYDSIISGGDCKTNNVNLNTGGNDNSIQLTNKPKKRGRKPGSKNQPKIPPIGGSHDVNIKKPKKLRMLMNIYGTGHGPQSAHDLIEPLNLTHGSVGTAGGLANIPLGIASTFPLYTQDGGGLRQLKKDHKKGKFKDNAHKRSSAVKSLPSSIVSSIVGPTKEEVDSINQKLLKMDTVLQPAPPLLISPMQSSIDTQNSFAICKKLLSSSPTSSSQAAKSKDNDLSPTKVSANNSKRHGNSSTSAAASTATSSGTTDNSFVSPTFPNMPGMTGLSMFPYYPFPPRPGLIPAHGLFPQLGQMTNSSAGMFLSGLMRFRCMNSGMRLPSLLNGGGAGVAAAGPGADDNNERNDRSSPQLPSASSLIDGERNYCNVAPLVPPDTVKFELSNPQYAKNLKTPRGGTSMKSTSSSLSSIAGGSDNIKAKLSPIMTSGLSITGRSFQTQSSVNSLSGLTSKSPSSSASAITPAAGVTTGHNFAFSEVNKSHFLTSTTNSHHGMDIFRNNSNNNSSNRSMILKNKLDEGPIEVSDDSEDGDDNDDDGDVVGGGAIKSNQQQFSSNNNFTFTSNSSQRLHDNNDLISGYDQQQHQPQQQHDRITYPLNDSILSNDRTMIKDLNRKKKQKSDKKGGFVITDTGNYESKLTNQNDLTSSFDTTKLSINNETITTTTNSLFQFPSSSTYKDLNIDSSNLMMTGEQMSTITSGTGTAPATTSTSFGLLKGGNKIINNSNNGFETISSSIGSLNNSSSISSTIVSSSSLLVSASSASFKMMNDDQQRHRDHKKLKRINRDGKIKKKKDRKDKSKTKELLSKSDKYLYKFEKRKDKDEKQRDKDHLKKLKKEKKKEKQQRPFDTTSLQMGQSKYIGSSTYGIGPGVGLGCVGGGGGGIESSSENLSTSLGVSLVPKLTLKLANSQSQMPQMNSVSSSNDLLDKSGGSGLIAKQKLNNKSGTANTNASSNLCNMKNNLMGAGGGTATSICGKVREPSPELARISPLVTRPPKQKTQIHVPNDNLNQATAKNVEDEVVYGTCGSSGNNSTKTILPAMLGTTHIYDVTNSNSNENVIGWMTGGSGGGDDEIKGGGGGGGGGDTGNYISSTTSKPKLSAGITIPSITTKTERTSSLASTTTSVHKNNSIPPLISSAVRPSSYIDAEGNRVWICPACGKVDDGSAMIGCDGCDAWYHWVCVGIFVAPKDNEDWFCRVCITKKKGIHGNDKKRRRNKKKSGNV